MPGAAVLEFQLDEVVVGITDYLLALECTLFAWMLQAGSGWRQVRLLFAAFFGVTALASLAGGTSHIFFAQSTSLPADVLWKATVLSLGATAFAAWGIGASLLFKKPTQGWIIKLAAAEFLVYAIYVASIDDRFIVAITNYIPAACFLALCFAVRYWQSRRAPILFGLAGLGVTAIAAQAQRARFALHPLYFNHNATYHAVQAIGLFLIFIAAVFFVRKGGEHESTGP